MTVWLAWLATAAVAQVSEVAVDDFEIEACHPRPVAGTVGYDLARQATATNAQAFGAVSFAERVLLRGSPWGVELHNHYNVTRVPTVAACPTGLRYGTAGVDVYAGASGLMIPFEAGSVEGKFFYAGSVTGSLVQFPSDKYFEDRIYTTYGYAAAAVAMTYAAPAAALVSRDDGLNTMAGDFVAGAELGLTRYPEVAALRLGYVYSQGLYSNLTSRRLRLFATALLADRFSVLALARGGLERVRLPWEGAGSPSLFGRNQVLRPAAPVADQGSPDVGRTDLTTFHFRQERIGEYVSVSAAVAVRPDVFLHEGAVTVHYPLDPTGDPDLEPMDLFRGTLGIEEMPAMPWYAVEGGRRLFFDIAVLDVLHVRRNDPDTLVIFPYAVDATEVALELDIAKLLRWNE